MSRTYREDVKKVNKHRSGLKAKKERWQAWGQKNSGTHGGWK